MVKIYYLLSKAGQKASLLAGGNGCDSQAVDVPSTAPEYPLAVAMAEVDSNGKAYIRCDYGSPQSSYNHRIDAIKYDVPPTISKLLEDEQARLQIYKNQQAERDEADRIEREEEIAKLLKRGSEALIDKRYNKWSLSYQNFADVPSLMPIFTEARSAIDENNRKLSEEEELEKIEEHRRICQVQAEQLEWIADNGSERLKKCIAEGIAHNGVYISERMAKEYPGWFNYSDHVAATKDPVNPPIGAFYLLDEARLICPDAKLMWASGLDRFCAESMFRHTTKPFIINYFGKDVTLSEINPTNDDE